MTRIFWAGQWRRGSCVGRVSQCLCVCGSLVNLWQRVGLSINERPRFTIVAAPGLGMSRDTRVCTAGGY